MYCFGEIYFIVLGWVKLSVLFKGVGVFKLDVVGGIGNNFVDLRI